jgi:Fe-S-cluster containining protein
MKIGRNSLCPCGSGKKFKHCCGATGGNSQHYGNAPDIFDIARRTAYAGSLGSAREAFSRNVLREKQGIFSIILENQKTDAERQGSKIACIPGCYYCCYHFIGGSLQECEAIVYYLYSHRNKLNNFFNQYPIWRNNTIEHEDIFQSLAFSYKILMDNGDRPEISEKHRRLAEEYYKLSIPCPFLHSGKCDIYPARPYGCAALFSLESPQSCDPAIPGAHNQRSVVSGQRETPYFFGENSFLIVSSVPLMVYEILKGGVWYLARLPGLQGMDREMFKDPRAAGLIRSARIPDWLVSTGRG